MLNLVIEINGKVNNIAIPQSWSEVPEDIFPHLVSIYLSPDSVMNAYDKTVRAFTLLTWKHYQVIEQLEPVELYDCLPIINWVFDKLDLTENKLPVIDAGTIKLYGPGNGMDNLRFGEWCVAETCMADYVASNEVDALLSLVATIYRPAGNGPEYTAGDEAYCGDIRQKFNDQLLPERKKLVAELNVNILQAVYLWYASCRKQIVNQYKQLFDAPAGQEEGNRPSGTWMDVYDDLRGDPKFAPAENWKTILHTVLHSLERNNILMKQLKDKHKL